MKRWCEPRRELTFTGPLVRPVDGWLRVVWSETVVIDIDATWRFERGAGRLIVSSARDEVHVHEVCPGEN